ncbi:MAG: flagellar basal body L-ring protein FlgH [Spartobacteria bacterium]|nr:flagellar basal body L-ring protein FlgH [Spartobacteria bacterium]
MKKAHTLIIFLGIILTSGSTWAVMDWSMAEELYAHKKARKIGDLLTVRIAEASSMQKDASRSASKSYDLSGSASFGHPQLDNRTIAWTNAVLPSFGVNGSRSFSGSGGVEDTDKFETYITVRVLDVYPNGDLLIEGNRTLFLKNDEVHMLLSGVVRVRDIDNDNIIESTKLADAVIRYQSTGSLDKTTKKGIIPKLVDWVNPF